MRQRLIPVLFLKNGYLVRSEGFSIHQNLGNPVSQVERYNKWDVDELIYIDISPDAHYDRGRDDTQIENPATIEEIISMVAKKCFMPLTFGGRIRTINDIQRRLALGADKVTINTMAIREPVFIEKAAKQFGSQAIVVSIDVKADDNGAYIVYSDLGKTRTPLSAKQWAKEVEARGAGEIFLNSIDRDGMATGYDITLIREITECTKIPVIACGGVGDYHDFKEGLIAGGASAVAAGNIFHFREMSYVLAKRALKKDGLNVR